MKKTLAASFIVTVSAGCTVAAGPPPESPPPQTTVEPAPPPPAPPAPVDMETPEPKDGGDGGLPEAGPDEQIMTKKDGTCWAMPDIDCPPSPATCNPPPPRQVACPDDAD